MKTTLIAVAGATVAVAVTAGRRSRERARPEWDVFTAAQHPPSSQDFALRGRADDGEVRHAWTGVQGLGWVTWQYFCSLAGIDLQARRHAHVLHRGDTGGTRAVLEWLG